MYARLTLIILLINTRALTIILYDVFLTYFFVVMLVVVCSSIIMQFIHICVLTNNMSI